MSNLSLVVFSIYDCPSIIRFPGGFDHSSPLNTVERYDPRLNDWTSMAPMSTSRGGVGVSVLGGKIFAIGGHNGSNYLTSVECYDPLTNR